MKHYKVRIVETLVMNVDVEAESAGGRIAEEKDHGFALFYGFDE